MGQLKDIDNDMRRRARILELTAKYMDQRIASLELKAAKALGFESVEQLLKEARQPAEGATAHMERRYGSRVFLSRLGVLPIRSELLAKLHGDKPLSDFEIGEIGETIAFHRFSEIVESSTKDESVARYFAESGVDPDVIQVRDFPGKNVYQPGPDLWFINKYTSEAVGIIEIKATTKYGSLSGALRKAIDRTQERFSKDKIDFVKRRYRTDLSKARLGLAISIFFDPGRLGNPDYEFSYRMAVVGTRGPKRKR